VPPFALAHCFTPKRKVLAVEPPTPISRAVAEDTPDASLMALARLGRSLSGSLHRSIYRPPAPT
jgi:hypothetical protein